MFDNPYYRNLLIWIIGILCVLGVVFLIIRLFSSSFRYPYFIQYFDVSGKHNPKIEDLIDEYLISDGFYDIHNHLKEISSWKNNCEERIEHSVFRRLRQKQYFQSVDDDRAFVFIAYRTQTRYKQVNYVRHPYQTHQNTMSYSVNFFWLQRRYNMLKDISFETTLSRYRSSEQRKLMTRQLREQIMRRDNYTCQICGKYMPDEVGLHIDHIVPVSKGGKSVPSNLQVLCSKCNGRKYNNYTNE